MKMKRLRRIGSIMIALMLTVMLPVIASAADTTTFATIEFTEGALIWGDLSGESLDKMNLSFGSHYRPTVAVKYETVNDPHSLSVEDAREETDGWNVTVSMSSFEAPDLTSFAGIVTLKSGVSDDEAVAAQEEVEIISDGGSADVLSAGVDAGRGMFTTLWEKAEDVTLKLSDTEALNVELTTSESYSATLFWVLEAGPS